ncbi:MAG: hypothetical protein CSA20_05675 [Deltaproteobacteria bacterium]|nr:MAG: hypothetical protein CSB23_03570 [Deltaproteobacteria bacterium]PIE72952.1 MAG: hypothetical protein CSA20_05675 [Deltaproteobacteria bacterium]
MKRYSPDTNNSYDLLIVGGGIYGAAMAYTAILNGLRTLLVEQDDFGQHTSAKSQKVLHGGLRYLQTLDIRRVMESIRERQRFYHLFPHQAQPLPCILPTQGYATKGNEAFYLAFRIYRLLERLVCKKKLDANRDKRPRLLSRDEVCQRFPHMQNRKFRGGALWYDGICLEPERVILGLIGGAMRLGCDAANYMKAGPIKRLATDTLSVQLQDTQTNTVHSVSCKKIALCTGPWFQERMLEAPLPKALAELNLIRGMNLVVPALFDSATSFATKAVSQAGSRFLFTVPWKTYSIEGTDWQECHSREELKEGIEQTTEEFHHLTCGILGFSGTDIPVLSRHIGLVPGCKKGKEEAAEQILSHYRLVDLEGRKSGDILQVLGVKFTTAFDVVLKALQRLFPKQKIQDILAYDNLPQGSPAQEALSVLSIYQQRYTGILDPGQCQTLFRLFGIDSPAIIKKEFISVVEHRQPVSTELFYRGLANHCIEKEMVFHLDDLIYRRIFPDLPGLPDKEIIDILADVLREKLGWTQEKRSEEIQSLKQRQQNQ